MGGIVGLERFYLQGQGRCEKIWLRYHYYKKKVVLQEFVHKRFITCALCGYVWLDSFLGFMVAEDSDIELGNRW